MTVDDVKRFHAQFYGASNAELAIVGDFDADATRALVTELFGDWKSPSAYARVPGPVPAQPAGGAAARSCPTRPTRSCSAASGCRSTTSNPDYPALLVASFILGDSSSARMPERLRQKDGLSYGAGTFFQPSAIDANSAIGTYAIFAPENLARVRTGFSEEFDRAVKDGFTDAEVKDGEGRRDAGAPASAAPRTAASRARWPARRSSAARSRRRRPSTRRSRS